ncbi:MAG: ABC transporter permease [Chloroflexota bacterium]
MTDLTISETSQRLIYIPDLLRELVTREMKLRYKESLLGVAWSLLNPLLQLLVLSFVFRYVLPLEIDNYTSFLFIGLLVWNWFQTSLISATTTIVDSRSLIKRPGLPIPILPVVSVMANLLHFLLALPVLALFLLLTGVDFQGTMLLLPIVIVIQFLFTLSLAYFLATFHVSFRDTQHLVGVFLMLLFYLSPIFYEPGAIPQRFQFLYRLNPVLHLVEAYRAILMYGTQPDWTALLALLLASSLLLFLGYRLFLRASYFFVEEL